MVEKKDIFQGVGGLITR